MSRARGTSGFDHGWSLSRERCSARRVERSVGRYDVVQESLSNGLELLGRTLLSESHEGADVLDPIQHPARVDQLKIDVVVALPQQVLEWSLDALFLRNRHNVRNVLAPEENAGIVARRRE